MICVDYIKRQFLEYIKTDLNKYASYLKKKGCNIGHDVNIIDGSIDMAFLSLISIGNHVTLTGTTILAHDASTQIPLGRTKIARVTIGNNVFAGSGTIILPGTVIGNNVIIGAGTVVRGNVPGDSVVMGNPWMKICSTDEFISKYTNQIGDCKEFEFQTQVDLVRNVTLHGGVGWVK